MKPLEFIKTLYQYDSFEEIILPYLTDKESNITVKKYTLPRDMSDSELQKENNSQPIPVEELASFLQKFIEKADKSKCYVFHVNVNSTVFALDLRWFGDEWNSSVYAFDDYGFDWFEGNVFVSPTQTLDSSPLETLTLEQAIGICVMAGYKVTKEI